MCYFFYFYVVSGAWNENNENTKTTTKMKTEIRNEKPTVASFDDEIEKCLMKTRKLIAPFFHFSKHKRRCMMVHIAHDA